MLKFESDKEKNTTNVEFKGNTHDIYKELLAAVVTTLDQMDLHNANGAVPLNESVMTFGQHLMTLAMKSGKELDEVSEIRRKAMRALDEFFGKCE